MSGVPDPRASRSSAAREVFPAWLGIRFGQAPERLRKAEGLLPGAASVTAVYPESPAAEGGLQAGDVVLGPPRAPFRDAGQVREWTMLAAVGKPAPLAVLREDERLDLTLVPKPFPVKRPELPGPPRVSSAAPDWGPLRLAAHRRELPASLRGGAPRVPGLRRERDADLRAGGWRGCDPLVLGRLLAGEEPGDRGLELGRDASRAGGAVARGCPISHGWLPPTQSALPVPRTAFRVSDRVDAHEIT
jgi:hypothetical protein